MSTVAVERVESRDPIGDALSRRVSARAAARHAAAVLDECRRDRRRAHDLIVLYGSTAAEQSSRTLAKQALALRTAKFRALARATVLERCGRRIDLDALMQERRPDGLPRWAIVDPCVSLTNAANQRTSEGKRDDDGTVMLGGTWRQKPAWSYRVNGGRVAHLPAGGIPPLPEAARALVTDRTIRRRAAWVGLLYQPEEWVELRPDPAVVVEWKDRPGEYYCLCVWGGDRARIMEFVL